MIDFHKLNITISSLTEENPYHVRMYKRVSDGFTGHRLEVTVHLEDYEGKPLPDMGKMFLNPLEELHLAMERLPHYLSSSLEILDLGEHHTKTDTYEIIASGTRSPRQSTPHIIRRSLSSAPAEWSYTLRATFTDGLSREEAQQALYLLGPLVGSRESDLTIPTKRFHVADNGTGTPYYFYR